MRLVLHPKVYSDIDEIMGYYMQQAAERPESFAIRERDLRRVNLQRFPYHFLFRIVGDVVRILVVRHHRRRPTVGIQRR